MKVTKKQIDQASTNRICEKMWESALSELRNYYPEERLDGCSASIITTPSFFILKSYSTLIGCIYRMNNVGYDLLRKEYPVIVDDERYNGQFPRTSARHLSKFFTSFGVTNKLQWRECPITIEQIWEGK